MNQSPRIRESAFKYFFGSGKHWTYILASGSILFVLAIYLWFGSFGLWTNLPTITTYYDKLATAFSHGSLSLEEKPDPALLALANPYDPAERVGIEVPTDYSYYNGKYYLYFGPVPALFLTIFKLLGFGTIGDQYPVFVFICGIFIIQSLLILEFWKRYFQNIPAWMVSISILVSGLIAPFAWILTQARFYEAASTSGQFFFLLGLYLAINAHTGENVSYSKMFMSGMAWAFSLGSRPTQILPIGFIGLVLLLLAFRSYQGNKSFAKSIAPILWLSAPFVIGACILGWYNWARFGSVFESGFYYELAGPYLQNYSHQLFSPVYIVPNLYNYLFMKPHIIESFPFLRSVEGIGAAKFPFISLPPIYFTRGLTGIFYSTPFVLFTSFLALPVKRAGKDIPDKNNKLFNWMVIVLLGSFFFEFVPFISYFWVETRFFVDFTPPLVILSVLGFWRNYSYFRNKPLSRNMIAVLGVSLIIIAIIVGTLLAFGAHRGGFKEFNPPLWKALYKDFNPLWWKQIFKILSP